MQVILLRWEVMGMPFACWNEAAADVSWPVAGRMKRLPESFQVAFLYVCVATIVN